MLLVKGLKFASINNVATPPKEDRAGVRQYQLELLQLLNDEAVPYSALEVRSKEGCIYQDLDLQHLIQERDRRREQYGLNPERCWEGFVREIKG